MEDGKCRGASVIGVDRACFGLTSSAISTTRGCSRGVTAGVHAVRLLSMLSVLYLIVLVVMRAVVTVGVTERGGLLRRETCASTHAKLPGEDTYGRVLGGGRVVDSPATYVVFSLGGLGFVGSAVKRSTKSQLVMGFTKLLHDMFPRGSFIKECNNSRFVMIVCSASGTRISRVLGYLYLRGSGLGGAKGRLRVSCTYK